MKISILSTLVLCLSFYAYAQNDTIPPQRCHATEVHHYHYENNESYRHQYNQDKIILDQIRSQAQFQGRLDCTTPIIVPVAVHYEGVTNQTTACLEQLALNQIATLNADYSASNSDITNYCTDISNGLDSASLAYNGTCIQFCLANQNHPAGFGLSNGDYAITINQNYVADNSFPNFTNGTWAGYLNFFITSGTGLLGYAPLNGSANGDGVVIEACAFGSAGHGCGGIGPGDGCNSNLAVYSGGRTISHEIGHYFGLNHIWGDGDCSVDDGFTDTPLAGAANYYCPAAGSTSCGSVDMTMNFMDYTNDACMYMFTEQQVNVMYNRASMLWSTTTDKCDGTSTYPTPLLEDTCNPTSECSVNITVDLGNACTGTPSTATAAPSNAPSASSATYAWSNDMTTATISGLEVGVTYTVTMTDSNNCTATASITINAVPTTLELTLNVANTACNTPTGSIGVNVTSGTAPYSYNWSNNATTAIISDLAPGTYTVTVTDSNDCTATQSATINTPPTPLQFILNTTHSACNTPTGSISTNVTSGTAPYTYNWSNDETTANINNLASGTYTVTITDSNNCTATASASTTATTAPQITLDITNPNCNNPTGSISTNITSGTAPYTYNWSNNATTANINNLESGTYTVTVTDSNNCTATASASISNATTPLSITGIVNNVSCHALSDGAIDVSINGGTVPFTYSWENGSATEDISNLPAGNYPIIVTDANNCSVERTFTVAQPDPLELNVVINHATNGASNGMATTNTTGGTPPFNWQWSNAASGSVIGGLAPGNYSVTVTDANGCTASNNGTVENTTNVFDPSVVTNWKIYPNPSKGIFYLEMQMAQQEAVEINVYNLIGQLVFQQSSTDDTIEETIDLSTWNAGSYFMEIKVGGTRVVEKLVLVK